MTPPDDDNASPRPCGRSPRGLGVFCGCRPCYGTPTVSGRNRREAGIAIMATFPSLRCNSSPGFRGVYLTEAESRQERRNAHDSVMDREAKPSGLGRVAEATGGLETRVSGAALTPVAAAARSAPQRAASRELESTVNTPCAIRVVSTKSRLDLAEVPECPEFEIPAPYVRRVLADT